MKESVSLDDPGKKAFLCHYTQKNKVAQTLNTPNWKDGATLNSLNVVIVFQELEL